MNIDPAVFRQIADASPEAVLLLDHDRVIGYANRRAVELLGPAVTGTVFSPEEEALPQVFRRSTGALLTAGKDSKIILLLNPAGEKITCSVRETVSGNYTILYINDITELTEYWKKLHRHKSAEDKLYRSQLIRESRLDEAIREITELAAATMQVERMNIWRIDENFKSITSIGNYDAKTGMLPNITLQRHTMPDYFRLLESEEIVLTSDSANDAQTAELRDNYIIPNGIQSMMDIPIRLEGRMVGLICFEETHRKRNWDIAEQKFGLSVAQIVALALETHSRRKAQKHLETALAEKQLLLREVNHRVKNNFELISDILRLQGASAKDDFHRQLFDDSLSRLRSIATTHRLLYQSDNINTVNFREFLLDLSGTYRPMLQSDGIQLVTLLDQVTLPMPKAVCAGLVVNELLSNALKHAFEKKENNTITIRLQQLANKIQLKVSDNGQGANFEGNDKNSTGLSLVNELVERLDGKLDHESKNGNHFTLRFAVS